MEIVKHPIMDSLVIRGFRVRDDVLPYSGNLGDAMEVLVAIVRGAFTVDEPPTPLTNDESPVMWPIALTDVKAVPPMSTEVFTFEHDLALYKPRTDIVVLGEPTPPPLVGVAGTLQQPWTMEVRLESGSMVGQFQDGRLVSFNNAPIQAGTPDDVGISFGWQERGEGSRTPLAGPEQSLNDFDPDASPLPNGFSNRYFNGGLYVGNEPVFTHPNPAGSTVEIESTATYEIGGGEPDKTETLPIDLTLPRAPIVDITFRTDDASDAPTVTQRMPMYLDTIVFNQPQKSYSAVWRGNWDFTSVPEERYVRLAIS